MPTHKKIKDLYIAKSLDQLIKKAEESKANINDVKSGVKSTLRLYDEAKNSLLSGDEERAYVLFYRFFETYSSLKKSNAIKKDEKYFNSMISPNKAQEVIDELSKLTESISKRYSALKESEELRAREIAESNQKLVTNSNINESNKSKLNEFIDNSYSTIDCISLLDSIESSSEITKILILDTRSSNDYNESHIDKLKTTGDITIANIPSNILIPGLTATRLEKVLAYGNSRDAYDRRRQMNKVVIVDQFSQEFIVNTPSYILADALWKWDYSAYKIKSKPLLLKGGYAEWVLTFPMFSSNPNVLSKASEPSISPKQIDLNFHYDFNEDEKEEKLVNNHVVNEVMNGDIDGKTDPIDSKLNSRVNNIFQPRPTNTAIPGTALPLIPDRSMKPKLQIEEKSTKNNIDVTHSEDFEKIKLRKQAEISEEMLSNLREGYDQTVKDFELQLKKKEEENNDLKCSVRKLLPEKPKSLISNPNENSKTSTIIAVNGEVDNCDKRNGLFIPNDENKENESHMKPHITMNGDINHNLNTEKPNKLMSTPKSSTNLLSINSSNLSRSLSSPNIAQLLAKELEEDHQMDNHLKVRSVTNPPQPQFDRNLKPAINREKFNFHESSTIDNKLRDFSPVYTTTPAITGLRNLGNTCFMNAVIQCLLNTPELLPFFSGKFNINKGTKFGSNGELTLELAALLRAMAFPSSYKSIAPKDFKNAVSRHLTSFIGCNQQDSHEFLVMLLEKLHEDLNQSNASNIIDTSIAEDLSLSVAANKFWKNHLQRNKSIITDLFEGLLVQTLTCLTCHKTSNTFEVFSCLSLPLTSYRTTLNDCLSQYFKPERMTGETAWECPTCKQKREADKKILIWKLPKVLLVHLKRFSYEGVWRQKLQTYVEFPIEDLKLQSLNSNEVHYSLYGVVNHYGTLEGGHYTAFSRCEKKYNWHRFDDQEITSMSAADVKTQAAYVLFYKCF